jgi:predicted ATPase
MPEIWVCISELRRRVWLHIPGDVWPKKFKRFVKEIFALDEPFSIRLAASKTGITREAAAKYIRIMEENGLLNSTVIGKPCEKIYFTRKDSMLEEIETWIRNSPGCLTQMWKSLLEFISDSLRYIMPALEASREF